MDDDSDLIGIVLFGTAPVLRIIVGSDTVVDTLFCFLEWFNGFVDKVLEEALKAVDNEGIVVDVGTTTAVDDKIGYIDKDKKSCSHVL